MVDPGFGVGGAGGVPIQMDTGYSVDVGRNGGGIMNGGQGAFKLS